ncbi:hypothetical protein [Salinibacterium sp. M195]|uniref:hypothetical protein n=1 Tax=Salinibacterium sp. M195 TaxID=2583374 RepID=UPI001C6265A9|nr:hypothetical protein [Salinibacterium sp. M195]QYH34585.1 hypothetical protein FFT87_00670 [Salinibacterium sp. M195]
MTAFDFYSDRLAGTHGQGEIPPSTVAGLVRLIETKMQSDWFAEAFPTKGSDRDCGTIGTNISAVNSEIHALIPDLGWPCRVDDEIDETAALDLVEWAAQKVSLPVRDRYHAHFGHWELVFNRKEGATALRDEVNQYLSRGRTLYSMNGLRVVRSGTAEVARVLNDLTPSTGDTHLDELIISARNLYKSHHEDERATGVEKLWDAFERIKTLGSPDKRAGISTLLGMVAPEKLRLALENDMIAVTKLGNEFSIRHHEKDTETIRGTDRDYFFLRAANLIIALLRHSGRLQQ